MILDKAASSGFIHSIVGSATNCLKRYTFLTSALPDVIMYLTGDSILCGYWQAGDDLCLALKHYI